MIAELQTMSLADNDLPPHVATADEPIPCRGERPHDGPDMRDATPVEQMLEWLLVLRDDEVGYIALWRRLLSSIGCTAMVHRSKDGEVGLMIGGPVDPQMRHRSRWCHFLLEDLDAIEGRRDALIRDLERARWLFDERPICRREVTAAVRGFLLSGGRLMIAPDGQLMEGPEVPAALIGDDDGAREACIQANRNYFGCRRRLRADMQIKRVVRMLGHPTDNGWIVLDAAGRTPSARWDAVYRAYREAHAFSDGLPDDEDADRLDDALDAYCEAMDRLIVATPAPSIAAVAEKMRLARYRGPDGEVAQDYAAAIHADLSRLTTEARA